MVCRETTLCGKRVQRMTLRHWIILSGIDCPFERGLTPEPHEIIQFLWVLSPAFKPFAPIRRFLFVLSCQKAPYGKWALDCQRFWDDTFQDQPPAVGDDTSYKSPSVSFAAAVVYQTCQAARLTRSEVMDTPLQESFQYMKLARIRQALMNGENPSEFNPSDKILKVWIREQRRLEKEAA